MPLTANSFTAKECIEQHSRSKINLGSIEFCQYQKKISLDDLKKKIIFEQVKPLKKFILSSVSSVILLKNEDNFLSNQTFRTHGNQLISCFTVCHFYTHEICSYQMVISFFHQKKIIVVFFPLSDHLHLGRLNVPFTESGYV